MHSMGLQTPQALIGLSFSWIFFSFVSPLETKGKPQNPPSPNQRKPTETEGNQRKSKDIKGYQRKNEIMYEERIFASSFVFLVVSFEFLPQLKAIFWCNPCVGKRDTTSFSPKTLVEMWNTCYRKHSCTDREKRKQKKTEENTRKPEVFQGKGRVIRGEHRII